jgi:two-component system sensor histidine kinase SenX3
VTAVLTGRSGEAQGGDVVIEVHDHGRGIPAEALERLFEPFQQVDSSDARLHGGTGLGLAIVRTIAQSHGGTVDVQSEVGVGSTFTVRLPQRAAEAPDHAGPAAGGRS